MPAGANSRREWGQKWEGKKGGKNGRGGRRGGGEERKREKKGREKGLHCDDTSTVPPCSPRLATGLDRNNPSGADPGFLVTGVQG